MISYILPFFVVLLIIGVPIAFILALMAILVYTVMGDTRLFIQIPQRMFAPYEITLLLAIPFFIMAGEVMNRSKITDRVMELASEMVGFLRGGLAHTNIVASMLFAGITGSAVADTAAIGTILIPAMNKQGYDRGFSAAVTASSSVIGPIIPPSIPMLIYSSVMNVSVAAMFLGGMLPGILVGVSLMVISWIISNRKDYGVMKRFYVPNLLRAMIKGVPALLMPVIIMGGILGGFFSPTQAASVAVFYGIFMGFVFFRTLKFSDFPAILSTTVKTTSMILFLLSCAKCFSWVIAYFKVIEGVTHLLLSISNNPYVLLLILNFILIVVGMFLDMGFGIIVLAPMLAPTFYELGIDPIHFGMIVCVNLTIGLATPPFGLVLFAVCGIAKLSLARVSLSILPFLLSEIFALLMVTYVPFFTLYFPKMFGFVK